MRGIVPISRAHNALAIKVVATANYIHNNMIRYCIDTNLVSVLTKELSYMADKKATIESAVSKKRAIQEQWDKKRSELKRGFDEWRGTVEPLTDLVDEGTQYVLRVELPGFDKDGVDVELNKDVLTLKAERKAESEKQAENYVLLERDYASLRRTIVFPEEVDPSKVEGTMDKGILTLTVPKRGARPEERMTKLKLK